MNASRAAKEADNNAGLSAASRQSEAQSDTPARINPPENAAPSGADSSGVDTYV